MKAEIDSEAVQYLNEETRFWIVRPRLSVSGVSGLTTLVSGAFIQMDPGGGEATRSFVGLEQPPPITYDEPGRRFVLNSETLGSLNPGSPIYFRGLKVGEVLSYELNDDALGITIPIFIREPFSRLIRDNTRFWNVSGVTGQLSASGLTISVQSLTTLLSGGIAFETPARWMDEEPSGKDTGFTLYSSYEAMKEAAFVAKQPFVIHFNESVRGLEVGAPVEFRGIRVGTVTDIRLQVDTEAARIQIPVTVNLEPERFISENEMPDVQGFNERMQRWFNRGLRAQLKSGNLLTGSLFVDLDLYPDAPPADLKLEDGVPVIPSVEGAGFGAVAQSATAVMDKIAKLPLENVIGELTSTIKTANDLLNRPSLRQAVESLDQIEPILANLNATVRKANNALEEAESTFSSTSRLVAADSPLQMELRALLRELRDAARSARVLADYLERNPEALIRGKGGR